MFPLHPGKLIEQHPQALGATSASSDLAEYILSSFPQEQLRALELGTGSGVISIMLALSRALWLITGIDIQGELTDLAKHNAQIHNTPVEFLQADLRTYTGIPACDLVFSNPPWQRPESGVASPHRIRAVSRMELCCTLPEIVACCTRNLRQGGSAVLMYPDARRHELLACAELSGLTLADTCSKDDKWTIIHFIKGL